MKRRTAYAVFVATTLGLIVVAGLQYGVLQRVRNLNATFMEAKTLLDAGDLDTAEPLLVELARDQGSEPVGLAARFALGNGYLGEALRDDIDPRRRRPLAELAKERYRELLRFEPRHWDARYNLERALRLAPERVAVNVDAGKDPVKRVDVVVPDFEPKDLP